MEKKKIYLVLTLVFIVLFIAVCLIDLFLENLEKKQELLLKVLEIISASSISFTLSCTISIKKSNRNNKTKVKSKNSNGVLVTQNNGDNNTTNLTYNNPVDIVKAVKETLVPYQEENVEKIMRKSIDALRKELPGQTLNKDFVMKYIDEASKINEEDIQDIWVKLLVQENKSSGSISKRTLDIVKNLYPAEAKLFESIAKYSLSNGTIHDCFCNKFSFIDISKLQDIGLMKSSDTIEQTITIDGNNPVPFCRIEGNTIFIIKNTSNTIEKISYKCHLLTNEGVELKSALGISIDKNDYLDYCRQIKQAKNQKNLMCSAHKINYFSSGQVNYEINDIL